MSASPAFDAEAFKRATRQQWNAAARGWNDWGPKIRDWLSEPTRIMLDMAEVKAGGRVLDIAAGAGDQTLDIAQRVGARGYVLATDISPGILEFAKDNARRAGFANIETRIADGENLGVAEASFDGAVCRLGLMLFPDPLQGLFEMWRAVKPGGRACTMVFSGADANPTLATTMAVACKWAGLDPLDAAQPGGLLSLARPGLIEELYTEAGFQDVETRPVSARFRAASAKDYVEFIKAAVGPIRDLLLQLEPSACAAGWTEMEEKLKPFESAGGFAAPHDLLITRGRRSE